MPKIPTCVECGKPVYKDDGWHITEEGIYHWDCLGDYGDRIDEVIAEAEEARRDRA